jgi:hypothetical protein
LLDPHLASRTSWVSVLLSRAFTAAFTAFRKRA